MTSDDEIYAAVVETAGFTAAARRLKLGKSAVSKAVGRLEQRLGTRLLHRTTRRVSLTEAGEIYYRHISEALRHRQAAEDAVQRLGEEPEGRLRVAAPMSLGLRELSRLVPAFLDRYPGMQVEVYLDDRVADMVEGGFDLAIRIGRLGDSGFMARRIGTMHAVLVASPTYLDRAGRPESPSELISHECLLYSLPLGGRDWTFDSEQGRYTVNVTGRYQVNSALGLRAATLADCGVARLPLYLVAADLRDGRLERVLGRFSLEGQPIHAVFPGRRFIPRKARVFADFLAAELPRVPGLTVAAAGH
ncbi:MAG: LysR family transcriptional regulator [Gammaproteobacteria bacterium]